MQQNGQEDRQDSFCEPMAFMSKGGSMGAGVHASPVVSVCNIFARGCWHSDIPRSRSLHPKALCQQNCWRVGSIPHLSLTLTLAQPRCNCKCNLTLTLDSRYNRRHMLWRGSISGDIWSSTHPPVPSIWLNLVNWLLLSRSASQRPANCRGTAGTRHVSRGCPPPLAPPLSASWTVWLSICDLWHNGSGSVLFVSVWLSVKSSTCTKGMFNFKL